MSAWLSKFDPKVVAKVKSVGKTIDLDDQQAFIHEGEIEDRLFIVESGTVEVVQVGRVVHRVSAGDIIGEFAFVDRRPRSATVRAAGAAKVCSLDRQDVVRVLADDSTALIAFLNAITTRMRSRLDGADASTDVPEFLASLTAESKKHRAVTHRYLRALGEGTLPDLRWAMADFGRQYFGYSAHFPRYLTAVISRLEKAEHRAALLENLTEESGVYAEEEFKELAAFGVEREWIAGIPHPTLFARFRRALGVSDASGEDDSMEVVCWREMFLGLLTGGTAAEAIGAMGLGTEGIVRDLYQPFVQALKRIPDLHPRDVVFFPLHTAVDDHHQATLLDIAAHYAKTEQGRRDIAKGMRKALALRSSYWDWMYERAMTLGASDAS